MTKEPEFQRYAVAYAYEGGTWQIDVMARNAEEAKRRLAAAAAWGDIQGPMLRVRVPFGTRLARLFGRGG